MDINEILTHLGENREEYFNAVSPPVVQTSNFVFNTTGELRKALQNEMNAHIYTRGNNPTVAILRKKLAALEKTEDALVTGSGSSAVAGAVMSFVGVGDHVICVQKPYSWTNKLLSSYLSNFGVEYDFVDARNVNEIENKIKPNTKILYLESPNSLTFELQDLSACCTLAKKK
jgi:cystathionine beta-lyase/cystathionine gamma-synthase